VKRIDFAVLVTKDFSVESVDALSDFRNQVLVDTHQIACFVYDLHFIMDHLVFIMFNCKSQAEKGVDFQACEIVYEYQGKTKPLLILRVVVFKNLRDFFS
jgi:hypothetical protein